MKTLFKTIAVAALLAGAAQGAQAAPAPKAAAAPAAAAAVGGVNGIAVANLDAVVANSVAYKKAQVDRDTTYKAQLDAAKSREAALNAQLKPLVEKFQKDRAAPGANQAALQAQVAELQKLQESGKAEIEKLVEPVRLSDAYVLEQIMDKRAAAVQAAMTKAGVTLLINPESVLAATNAYNLNQAILNELNAALPSVQVVPPAGWLPREVREQQAQQGAAPASGAESR